MPLSPLSPVFKLATSRSLPYVPIRPLGQQAAKVGAGPRAASFSFAKFASIRSQR